MTQPTDISDATLITRTRDGDMSAYDELYRRHLDDATKVAHIVTNNRDEAQDVVSEAFTRVLNRLMAGGGPEDELAPYLRTVVRRLAIDRHRSAQRSGPADPSTFDVLPTIDDPMARATDQQLVRRAFETLPPRWQEVLWHTEIEGRSPASLASRLDTTPNAVAALAYRAREGLRQAYLSMNLSTEVAGACRPFSRKIPALVRGTLPARDTRPMLDHLGTCGHCRERRDELLILVSDLPATLAPALLLPAAAAGAGVATGAGAAGGGLLAWLSPSRWGKTGQVTATSGTIAAAAAIAVAAIIALSDSPDDPPTAAPSSEPEDVAEAAPVPPNQDPPPEDTPPPEDNPPPSDTPPLDEPEDAGSADPPPDSEPPGEPGPPPDTAQAPGFDTHPQDVIVRAGEQVTLTTAVSGNPEPELQWQVREPSLGTAGTAGVAAAPVANWTDVPGEAGPEITLVNPTPASNGRAFRVVATNSHGDAVSDAASLTVHYAPRILTHPADADAQFGGDVELHAAAEANPAVETVRWQVRGDEGWVDVPGDFSGDSPASLTVSDVDFSDDAQYRAVFGNQIGTSSTNASALSVTATGQLQTEVRRGPRWALGTKCMRPDGNRVRVSDCDGAMWRLGADGSLHWAADGQCLDVPPNDARPRLATTGPCTHAKSQTWTLDPADTSRQELRNERNVCLDVQGWRRHDGAVGAHSCSSRWNERFIFTH